MRCLFAVLRGFAVAATFVVVALLVPDAVAEHRVALVIGNADYKSIGTLANPGINARLLAGAFYFAGNSQASGVRK